MSYRLHKWPEDVQTLTSPSEPIEELTGELRDLAEMMVQLTGPDKGTAGFAAVQFGVLKRLIVFQRDTQTIISMINPTIIKQRGEQTVQEGCMSVPGKLYMVSRPAIVTVTGHDLAGNRLTVKAHDFLAQVIKHECDHCEGVLVYQRGRLI
jgi:peptide deformylase